MTSPARITDPNTSTCYKRVRQRQKNIKIEFLLHTAQQNTRYEQTWNCAPCTISCATYYSLRFRVITAYSRNLNLYFAKILSDPAGTKPGRKISSENHLFRRNPCGSECFLLHYKKFKAHRRCEFLMVFEVKMQVWTRAGACSDLAALFSRRLQRPLQRHLQHSLQRGPHWRRVQRHLYRGFQHSPQRHLLARFAVPFACSATCGAVWNATTNATTNAA